MSKILVMFLFCGFSVANAADYVVTDVICRSGSTVVFEETVSPGYIMEVSGEKDAGGSEFLKELMLKELMVDNVQLKSILEDDNSKRILFVSTCDVGNAYKSGRGPCPENDQVIGIGKRK